MRSAKSADDETAPTSPSSSPMMAKMKSVYGLRQVEELLLGVAQPRPSQPPEPRARKDWMIWKPLPCGSSQGFMERDHAPPPVGLDGDEPAITTGRAQRAIARHDARARAPPGRRARAVRMTRARLLPRSRLEQGERGHAARHQRIGTSPRRSSARSPARRREERGQVEHKRRTFASSTGWNETRADAEPASRAD